MKKTGIVRIGIVGTGIWANNHAENYSHIRGVRLAACCDVDATRARAFARRHGIERVYTDYAAMLADAPIDAVDVVTTDAMHAEIAIAALKRRLHVMCEKPLATTVADARAMLRAARRARVIHMVNFTNRNSSALHKASRLIALGRLGQIRHVEAGYMQSWLVSNAWGDWRKDPAWLWRLSTAAGSGGVLADVGCHILDFAAYAVGDISSLSCVLKTFDKGVGRKYKGYTLDANDSAVITASFANGALGTIRCTRWAAGHLNTIYLHVFGTKGALKINLDEGRDRLMVCLGKDVHTAAWRPIQCGPGKTNYRRFIDSIRSGRNEGPTFADGLRIQQYLDACRRSSDNAAEVRVRPLA